MNNVGFLNHSHTNKQHPRVLIGIPAQDQVKTAFVNSLLSLISYTSNNQIYCEHMFSVGSVLPAQRENIVLHSLRNSFTHIMWLDSDISCPSETIVQLLLHNLPVVGCDYSTRGRQRNITARVKTSDNQYTIVDYKEEDRRLVQVAAVGMGCLLTRTELFNNIDRPWFPITFQNNEHGMYYLGEDIGFCNLLSANNIEINVDVKLSLQVEHIGTCSFVI